MEIQKTLPKQKPKEEGCRIRIRKTKNGKEINFSGNCTKSQLNLASGNIEADDEE